MALESIDPLPITLLILLSSVARSVDSATAAGQKLLHLGGSRPITEPENNRRVVDIADFAVDEHNKLAKTNLKLLSVINGTMLVLGGTYYKLVLSAVDQTNSTQNYVTLVYEKPWQHLKILIRFKEVPIL